MLPPAPDGTPSTVGQPLSEGGTVISLAAYRQRAIDPNTFDRQRAIDPNTFVCPITGELWLNSVCARSSTKLHDSCVGCPAAKLRCLVTAIAVEIPG